MKICLINNLYRPYNKGGAEIVTEKIAGGLKKRGYKIFVITTRPAINQLNNAPCDYRIYRLYPLNIISYFNLSKLPKTLRLFWHIIDAFNICNYFTIKSILKKEKPDLVLTHNLKGVGGLTPLAIKRLGLKHIHTLHDIQLLHPSGLMFFGREKIIKSPFAKCYISINRRLFNSPSAVISPSNWLLLLHKKNIFFPKSKNIVVPNPIEIKAAGKTSSIEKSFFNFLYAGQIENAKGIEIMISAFQRLCAAQAEKKFRLNIIGDGSKLSQHKKQYLSNKNIVFLGKIPNFEVLEAMKRSQALIMPSICYENSPTVIYEALSLNLPVIASRIGGITEIIHEFGGLLFQPENINDLLRQMKWLINNYGPIKNNRKKNLAKLAKLSLDEYLDRLLNL